MPIQTVCQGCQRTLRVPDEHAGRKARCPQCQTVFVVPDPRQAETPAPKAETPSSNQFNPVARSIPAAGPMGGGTPSHSPDVRWRVRLSDGREYGPVSRQELDSWYQQDRLTADAHVQQEGHESWLPATTLYPALSRPAVYPAAPSSNPFGKDLPTGANPFSDAAAPQGGFANPYASPYGASSYGATSTPYLRQNRGTVVLILSLVGFFACCFLNIAAIYMAIEDKKEIAAGRMSRENEGLLTAGIIISAIPIALNALGLLFVLVSIIAQGP